MTREERGKAIEHINDILTEATEHEDSVSYVTSEDATWLRLAIKALEQEPCEDAVSRQAVFDAMRRNHRSGGRDIDGDYIEGNYSENLYTDIISLPPVKPQYTEAEIQKMQELEQAELEKAYELGIEEADRE